MRLSAVTTEVTERAIISNDEEEVGSRFSRLNCASQQDDQRQQDSSIHEWMVLSSEDWQIWQWFWRLFIKVKSAAAVFGSGYH
jgi:hypothetical protein